MNDEERDEMVMNDEGLYNWWRDTGLSRRAFIRKYRREIDEVIENVTSGRKPAHYLEYEKKPKKPPGGEWNGLDGARDEALDGLVR